MVGTILNTAILAGCGGYVYVGLRLGDIMLMLRVIGRRFPGCKASRLG
jgi:hypothetical protein